MNDEDQVERARRFLANHLVWDNHGCMPLRPSDQSFLPQLERYAAAGVDVVSLNIGFGPQTLVEHLRVLASMRLWLAGRHERYAMPRTLQEVDRARAEGKLSVLFDVEGMVPLDEGDDGLVELLADNGVRWMLVAYNRANAAGGGCYDEEDAGLTAHGRAVLKEMKRCGMVVCCSHTGHRTARDVFAAADNPVIFSHSNASAVHAHTRNIPDVLIKECAATGGVIGVVGIGIFLGTNDDRPETFVSHIDHMVQLVGPDHVGFSLDYVFDQQELLDYLATLRETFPDDETLHGAPKMVAPEALPAIVGGLFARGYAEADVAKIMGGNWRRVAEAVWR